MISSILFSLLLSFDAFTSSMAYGMGKIKIPIFSIFIISGMGTIFLSISFLISFFLKDILNENICTVISFIILNLLGIYNLLCNYIKEKLKKKRKQIKISVSKINILMDIYVDETKADLDNSNYLSFREALFLGAALSVDSLATGFSIGLSNVSYLFIIFLSFLINFIAIIWGSYLGKKISKKINLYWLSGTLLIIISFLKLFLI